LGNQLSGDHLSFQWQNILKPMEKDLADTRIYSTITIIQKQTDFMSSARVLPIPKLKFSAAQ
jgi:hypothetical protein